MKDVSLHVLDIVQNSISAGATLIELSVIEQKEENVYKIVFKDNGKGMSPEMAAIVSDPFVTSRTTRKVGLGLPFLKQNAELAGGSFKIESEINNGTTVEAIFELNNIDRIPAGDLPGSYMLLVTANPDLDFVFSHSTHKDTYVFDTREVKEVLGDIPINDLSVNRYLSDMIRENLKDIDAEFSQG